VPDAFAFDINDPWEENLQHLITAHVLLGVLQSIDDLVECFKYDDTQNQPQRRWYRSLSQR